MSGGGKGLAPLPGPSSFYGAVLRTALGGGFRVRESLYRNGIKTPWHRHDKSYFAFTLRGESQKSYAHSAILADCGPGTLVFHPPDRIHRDTFRPPEVQILQIEVEPSRMDVFKHSLTQLPSAKNLACPVINSLAARLHEELRRLDDLSPLVVEGLVLEMLAQLFRTSNHSLDRKVPSWLLHAEEMVRARFAEPIKLSGVAAEVGIHPVHLAREFRRYRGCTLGEMVRRLRVEYACREIARSKRPLSEIALDAGFADQSHFSNTFRSYTGMSPSEFSRTHHPANVFPVS